MGAVKRLLHTTRVVRARKRGLELDPAYKMTCGLEIHTQLKTRHKLFSLSQNRFDSTPNSNISYFDCGLPGTIPKLNPEALLLSLKAAVAMNCEVATLSSFDRKHYFYPDQPLGYQITQQFRPIAKEGEIILRRDLDSISDEYKRIRIKQIQLEQDTGKTLYDSFDGVIRIDLNRANIPLIEVVTEPDFGSLIEIKAFVKKYQTLVRYLNICSGDMENGAIRVDVNISINGGNRVEIKNLGSTSEIQAALESEYERQVALLKEGGTVEQETRGLRGDDTIRLRSKEDALDYRYFPDSELPLIRLDPSISFQIQNTIPDLPDDMILKLSAAPYNLELRHAKFLVQHQQILDYYMKLFDIVVSQHGKEVKYVNNWLIHEYLGAFNKLNIVMDLTLIPPEALGNIVTLVAEKEISTASAKQLVLNILSNPSDIGTSITDLIEKYDLGQIKGVSSDEIDNAVAELCSCIADENPDVIKKIRKGKKKAIKHLIGLAMKESQGKVDSTLIENHLLAIINDHNNNGE